MALDLFGLNCKVRLKFSLNIGLKFELKVQAYILKESKKKSEFKFYRHMIRRACWRQIGGDKLLVSTSQRALQRVCARLLESNRFSVLKFLVTVC